MAAHIGPRFCIYPILNLNAILNHDAHNQDTKKIQSDLIKKCGRTNEIEMERHMEMRGEGN